MAFAALLCLAAIQAQTAAADPTYGTINAEGGIYWRSGPDWNTAEAVSGFGFYPDTVIEVHCYQGGAGDVPGSTDSMWEQATDVGGQGYGSGWVNEHFINDGQPLNQPSPGVPPCGSSPSPPQAPVTPAPAPVPAPAVSGPVFPVANAEGGVYWRSAPDWNTPEAVAGNGFYEGTTVAVHCYQSGTSVPDSSDTMWEQASVVGGPGYGSGWINEHFINDGAAIDQPSPGVGPCSGGPPPSATPVPPKSSPPGPSQEVLVVDPAYWCVHHDIHRFDTQIRESDWQVFFAGVQGTPHQNDWKCAYHVVMTVPGLDGNSGPLPPATERFPIDFREVCEEQYPGSTLQYQKGPVYSTAWPWVCIGKPGKYYPTPTLNIENLVSDGGFNADGIYAAGAGHLSLRLLSASPKKRHSSNSRSLLLAKGQRSVRRAGRYSLRVDLTNAGSRILRRERRLRVSFILKVSKRSGTSRRGSTIVTLRR